MRSIGQLLGIGTALLLTAHSSPALEITSGIRDVSTITNDRGEERILFRLPDLGLPENALILRVTLEFTVDAEPDSLPEQIQVHPVTAPWTAGAVDWASSWQRPGGDIDPDLYSRIDVDLSEGGHAIGLDLTNLVKAQIEEGLYTDGFLLTVPPYAGEGIRSSSIARYLPIAGATIDVAYREVTRPPRGR
jgi:hypothetical protein